MEENCFGTAEWHMILKVKQSIEYEWVITNNMMTYFYIGISCFYTMHAFKDKCQKHPETVLLK
jgi:hypothetical protein